MTSAHTSRTLSCPKLYLAAYLYLAFGGAGKSAISDITDSVKEVTTTTRNAPRMPVETPLYGEEIYGEEIYGLEQMVDIL